MLEATMGRRRKFLLCMSIGHCLWRSLFQMVYVIPVETENCLQDLLQFPGGIFPHLFFLRYFLFVFFSILIFNSTLYTLLDRRSYTSRAVDFIHHSQNYRICATDSWKIARSPIFSDVHTFQQNFISHAPI